MTILDHDFEERLKETNFPDLLAGEASSTAVTAQRKAGTRKKAVVAEKNQRMEKRRPKERMARTTVKIVDLAPRNHHELHRRNVSQRPRIDPPSAKKDIKINKKSSATDDELLDNLLDDEYIAGVDHKRDKLSKGQVHKDFLEEDHYTSRAAKVAKKVSGTRLTKRDFIEDAEYGSGESKISGKGSGASGRPPKKKEREIGHSSLSSPRSASSHNHNQAVRGIRGEVKHVSAVPVPAVFPTTTVEQLSDMLFNGYEVTLNRANNATSSPPISANSRERESRNVRDRAKVQTTVPMSTITLTTTREVMPPVMLCNGYEVAYDRNALNDHESEITDGFNDKVKTTSSPVKKALTPSQGTSKTDTSNFSPVANLGLAELRIQDDRESTVSSLHGEDDDDDSSSSSEISEDAAALLERAQDRIARQHLHDEVEELKAIIERKNGEIESLSGQLRQAVATKCDLVIAHNELEKACENAVQRKESNLLQMKKANIWLLEAQSRKEKELLNEIINLTNQCKDTEQKHREELDDWERMHRNEMLEKDFEIAKLTEELRKAKRGPVESVGSDSILTSATKYFLNQ